MRRVKEDPKDPHRTTLPRKRVAPELDGRDGADGLRPDDREGHAGIAITLATYSHVVPGMPEEAAEAVSALVFGADG